MQDIHILLNLVNNNLLLFCKLEESGFKMSCFPVWRPKGNNYLIVGALMNMLWKVETCLVV